VLDPRARLWRLAGHSLRREGALSPNFALSPREAPEYTGVGGKADCVVLGVEATAAETSGSEEKSAGTGDAVELLLTLYGLYLHA